MGHVPHAYVPSPWSEPILMLDPALDHHLRRVLRLAPGAAVSYTDGRGTVGSGTLATSGITRGNERAVSRPALELTLAVAPPRSTARSRVLVEKLAELGVDRLRWLETRHGRGRPPRTDKAAAWAVAGLEQSRGAWLLSIDEQPRRLEELAMDHPGLLVARHGGAPFRKPPAGSVVVVAIGPEAGFTDEEIPPRTQGLGLGARVLRVETAAIVAAALVRASP
jgi:RsmE family RNA methyltransferase